MGSAAVTGGGVSGVFACGDYVGGDLVVVDEHGTAQLDTAAYPRIVVPSGSQYHGLSELCLAGLCLEVD